MTVYTRPWYARASKPPPSFAPGKLCQGRRRPPIATRMSQRTASHNSPAHHSRISTMMLAGTTALATLLATASAMPTVNTEHRALAERRTLACWSGDYTAERCCAGAGGDASCWSGEYNFEACCGQHVAVAPANPQPAPDSAAMTPHTNFLGDLGGDDIDVAMATVMGPNFVQQVVEALVTDADGRHHLWFKSLDDRPQP